MNPSLVVGRQGKFTFRLLAIALVGQAVILSFFALAARANAVAADRPDDGQTLLWVGLGLSALALLAAASMRTSFGITLGWVVQLLTWVSGVIVPVMVAVGLVFTGLWVLLLLQGRKVDRLVAEREAAAGAEEPATAD